jgi:hypothetical protein
MTDAQLMAVGAAHKFGYVFLGMVEDPLGNPHNNARVIDKDTNDTMDIYPDGTDYQGLPFQQALEGYWVDPAGGVHPPQREGEDFYDPASMYE